ncbi:methyltransferase domain-containing protein [Micromonospora sp. CPCC 205371]|nr:methyltransferase domain-containing protein [Micromonospora sp. CPCC 205371]
MTMAEADKQRIAGVFDRAAPMYEQTGVAFFDPLGAALATHAGLRPGERILDVGCGRGASLIPAAEAVGPSGAAIGIDLAVGMVEATAAEARRRGLAHLHVQVGDAEAPDFPDASFDAVLAGLVLFFLPDAPAAVRAYARLLRPGGRLVISTFTEVSDADKEWFEHFGQALGPYLPPPPEPVPGSPPPPDARLRTRESLVELLAGGGFSDVRFTEKAHRTVFARPEQFWDWLWSAGMRGMMESIPAQDHDDARAALTTLVAERLRSDDGTLGWATTIRLTTARRP